MSIIKDVARRLISITLMIAIVSGSLPVQSASAKHVRYENDCEGKSEPKDQYSIQKKEMCAAAKKSIRAARVNTRLAAGWGAVSAMCWTQCLMPQGFAIGKLSGGGICKGSALAAGLLDVVESERFLDSPQKRNAWLGMLGAAGLVGGDMILDNNLKKSPAGPSSSYSAKPVVIMGKTETQATHGVLSIDQAAFKSSKDFNSYTKSWSQIEGTLIGKEIAFQKGKDSATVQFNHIWKTGRELVMTDPKLKTQAEREKALDALWATEQTAYVNRVNNLKNTINAARVTAHKSLVSLNEKWLSKLAEKRKVLAWDPRIEKPYGPTGRNPAATPTPGPTGSATPTAASTPRGPKPKATGPTVTDKVWREVAKLEAEPLKKNKAASPYAKIYDDTWASSVKSGEKLESRYKQLLNEAQQKFARDYEEAKRYIDANPNSVSVQEKNQQLLKAWDEFDWTFQETKIALDNEVSTGRKNLRRVLLSLNNDLTKRLASIGDDSGLATEETAEAKADRKKGGLNSAQMLGIGAAALTGLGYLANRGDKNKGTAGASLPAFDFAWGKDGSKMSVEEIQAATEKLGERYGALGETGYGAEKTKILNEMERLAKQRMVKDRLDLDQAYNEGALAAINQNPELKARFEAASSASEKAKIMSEVEFPNKADIQARREGSLAAEKEMNAAIEAGRQDVAENGSKPPTETASADGKGAANKMAGKKSDRDWGACAIAAYATMLTVQKYNGVRNAKSATQSALDYIEKRLDPKNKNPGVVVGPNGETPVAEEAEAIAGGSGSEGTWYWDDQDSPGCRNSSVGCTLADDPELNGLIGDNDAKLASEFEVTTGSSYGDWVDGVSAAALAGKFDPATLIGKAVAGSKRVPVSALKSVLPTLAAVQSDLMNHPGGAPFNPSAQGMLADQQRQPSGLLLGRGETAPQALGFTPTEIEKGDGMTGFFAGAPKDWKEPNSVQNPQGDLFIRVTFRHKVFDRRFVNGVPSERGLASQPR